MYHKVVDGIEIPLESKLFGRTLSQREAEELAMHFIIKQEEENPLVLYGDPVVTEYLNYFSFDDGDVIKGYYHLIEEDDSTYPSDETFEVADIVTFSKINRFILKIENEEDELLFNLMNLYEYLPSLESDSKKLIGVHVVLSNEKSPHREIEIDLKEMENKNYEAYDFGFHLIKYLNKIDTTRVDDIVISADLDMQHYTIEIEES